MKQNYNIVASFTNSKIKKVTLLTVSQKNVPDSMSKLVAAVNMIFANATISVKISGIDEFGETTKIPVEMKITNIPCWIYNKTLDILIAPFSTNIGIDGILMIEEMD